MGESEVSQYMSLLNKLGIGAFEWLNHQAAVSLNKDKTAVSKASRYMSLLNKLVIEAFE